MTQPGDKVVKCSLPWCNEPATYRAVNGRKISYYCADHSAKFVGPNWHLIPIPSNEEWDKSALVAAAIAIGAAALCTMAAAISRYL